MIPVRLHLNRVISHTTFPIGSSLHDLQIRIQNNFDIKINANKLLFSYKRGTAMLKITNDDVLKGVIEHWVKSDTPKLELFLEVVH